MLYQHCDFHIHTNLSACARDHMLLPTILSTCADNGIEHIGITDHIHASTDSESLLKQAKQDLSAVGNPANVFLGCEADIISIGQNTVTQEMIAELDYIAVAANHFQCSGISQPASSEPRDVARHHLDMFKYACALEFAHIIVHPLYVMPKTHDPQALQLLEDNEILEAVYTAKSNGIAMEISHRGLGPDQIDFRRRFFGLCKEAGSKFSIGSDAHRLEMVGRWDLLSSIIDEIGIGDEDIWLPEKAVSI